MSCHSPSIYFEGTLLILGVIPIITTIVMYLFIMHKDHRDNIKKKYFQQAYLKYEYYRMVAFHLCRLVRRHSKLISSFGTCKNCLISTYF